MKKTFLVFVGVFLVFSSLLLGNMNPEKDKTAAVNSFRVLCTPDLHNLVQQWTSLYCGQNPGLDVELVTVNTGEMQRLISSSADLGFISDPSGQQAENTTSWKMVIGRDVIVPVINEQNPFIADINNMGISPASLKIMLMSEGETSWSTLTGNGNASPVNYYYIADKSLNSCLEGFIEASTAKGTGIERTTGEELVSSVQNDIYGFGFCRLTDLVDNVNHALPANIKLAPIDRNSNGHLDYFESIYSSIDDLIRGVWIGKYPRTLVSELYAVSGEVPVNEQKTAFMKWVLTEGQQLLASNGYGELLVNERQSKLEAFNTPEIYADGSTESYGFNRTMVWVLVLFVALAFSIFILVKMSRRKTAKSSERKISHPGVINENSLDLPAGIYFDKTHTWTFMEKDGLVRVGIDDFLQHVAGPFTRIIMRKTGETVKKSDPLLSLVQHGKQLNIYAPVSGTIKEVNKTLFSDPSIVNSSPYSEGWIYMIEPSNWLREIQFLQMAVKYKVWLRSEFLRLKDFLTATVYAKHTEPVGITFQEGGEIIDHVLRDFGPEAWEDFQKQFIDTAELQ